MHLLRVKQGVAQGVAHRNTCVCDVKVNFTNGLRNFVVSLLAWTSLEC